MFRRYKIWRKTPAKGGKIANDKTEPKKQSFEWDQQECAINHRQARNKKKSDKKLGAESLWSMTVLSLLRALSGPNISFLIRGGVHVCNVRLLELVESGQCSCSRHSSQDIGSCALEKGWDALILQNLHRAVHRPRVLDRLSRRHHHATTDSVNRIRRDTR